jgi:hypothetical protein
VASHKKNGEFLASTRIRQIRRRVAIAYYFCYHFFTQFILLVTLRHYYVLQTTFNVNAKCLLSQNNTCNA